MSAPHGMGPPRILKKPRRLTPEQDFQMQVKKFLELALPTPDAWFGASAAIGTSRTTGGILQGMGYKPGTPDMVVIWKPKHFGPVVLWLELKAGRGKPSDVQKQCREDLVAAGCKWALCRTLDDVERALRRFGVPLRASVGGVVREVA